jgi:hypothetical protein
VVLEVLGKLFLLRSPAPRTWCSHMSKNFTFRTAGGRIVCIQCQATAKSTHQQCRRPATKGKKVCKLHGGKSTGPQTPEGRQRCAAAKTIHGQETTSIRMGRRLASARLAVLEWAGHTLGFMRGARTRGRKPTGMKEACPELQQALRDLGAGD